MKNHKDFLNPSNSLIVIKQQDYTDDTEAERGKIQLPV